jgi:hypothetical protein
MLTLVTFERSRVMKVCRDGTAGGATSASLVRHLLYTTPSSTEPGRDTYYLVHPPGGMLEVGKVSPHQLRIFFWSFRHMQSFQQQLVFEMTLRILRVVRVPRRRYVEGCVKIIRGQEDLAAAYVSP